MSWDYTNTQTENKRNAILTDTLVNRIRFLYKFGKFSQKKLADRFNVAQTTISKIVRKASWN